MKKTWLVIVIAILGGCASRPPASIGMTLTENLRLAEVRADAGRFVGSEVRWGGVISKVDNKATHTWVELVGRDLRKDGKPARDGKSDGRFIASFPGFADPVMYEVGRLLTVVGTIEGQTSRTIGEYDYTFPIVSVMGSYLWKGESEVYVPYYPPPWWYYDRRYYYPGPYPYYRWRY
jgi:outer membrane lipoprotein